jgi:hypothetical protein
MKMNSPSPEKEHHPPSHDMIQMYKILLSVKMENMSMRD